jgi:hypothetical protein
VRGTIDRCRKEEVEREAEKMKESEAQDKASNRKRAVGREPL